MQTTRAARSLVIFSLVILTTGTPITLSVTNGRDAIWSGACSSGGDKRRTCTFTLSGHASVAANVQ